MVAGDMSLKATSNDLIAEYDQVEEAMEMLETVKLQKPKQDEFKTVFVGGLPSDASEKDVEKVFEKAGQVVDITMPKDPMSNKNKGFAFVRFATAEQAKKAATGQANSF